MDDRERMAVIKELHTILGEGDLIKLVRGMVEENNSMHKKIAYYKAKLSEEQMINSESNKEFTSVKAELLELREKYSEREKRVEELSSPDTRYVVMDAELRTIREDRSRLDEESRQLSRTNIAMKSKLHSLEEDYKNQISTLQATVNTIDKALEEEGITTHNSDRVQAIRTMRQKEAELLAAANSERREAEEMRDTVISEVLFLRSELQWRRRAPYAICGLRLRPRRPHTHSNSCESPQRNGSPDSSQEEVCNDVSISIIDVSPVIPPKRIEVRLPTRSLKYSFDEVLPAWSDMDHIVKAAPGAIGAGFAGIYSVLMMVPADSTVNAMTTPQHLHALAKEVMASAERSQEQQGWSWNIHFSCVELKTDTVRDLLNPDKEYIETQTAGGHLSVAHEIREVKGIPVISECASPSVKNVTKLTNLIDIAFENRSTTPDGELRGHTAYVFSMSGSKNGGRNIISGSFTLIDLASDSEMAVEIPPGASVDDCTVISKACQQRDRERSYVRRTLSQLQALVALNSSTTDAVFEEKERPKPITQPQHPASPYRRKGYTGEQILTVGQEVIIRGLVSSEYSHLNGAKGVVLGRSDYESSTDVKGRILVELSHELTLPFLFSNLIAVPPGLETTSTADKVSFSGLSRHSSASSQSKKIINRKKQSRVSTKSSTRSVSQTVDLSLQESSYNIKRSFLNQLVKPCFEGGALTSVVRLPTEGPESVCTAALAFSERLSRCCLRELVIHESGVSA
eukprot:TRINITY_DN9224_c4_g1_i1.p1 TRINITY_DN9224_c4_g1~~TRINITY_DN9224_c4_g1_i1.p1  ORF type:complete len:742 (+),score=140.05 TRINITY_DN9224_c4_g1_i1:62-2287(+)